MLNFPQQFCQMLTSGVKLTQEQKPRIGYRAVFPFSPRQGNPHFPTYMPFHNNMRSLDYSFYSLYSQVLALGASALFVPSHLLVTFLAHTTSLSSSRDESEHLLKILIAIQMTAAIPPEDETSFLAMLFLSSLLNSHMSVDFFPPNKSSVILWSFSFQSWIQQ